MANKKADLIKKVQESARKPEPDRFRDSKLAKGYRIVSASLYTPEADWIENITKALKSIGHPKANRSLVVREAILRLQEQLDQKTPIEIAKDFAEHQYRRSQKG
jgi:hypothetical protein